MRSHGRAFEPAQRIAKPPEPEDSERQKAQPAGHQRARIAQQQGQHGRAEEQRAAMIGHGKPGKQRSVERQLTGGIKRRRKRETQNAKACQRKQDGGRVSRAKRPDPYADQIGGEADENLHPEGGRQVHHRAGREGLNRFAVLDASGILHRQRQRPGAQECVKRRLAGEKASHIAIGFQRVRLFQQILRGQGRVRAVGGAHRLQRERGQKARNRPVFGNLDDLDGLAIFTGQKAEAKPRSLGGGNRNQNGQCQTGHGQKQHQGNRRQSAWHGLERLIRVI